MKKISLSTTLLFCLCISFSTTLLAQEGKTVQKPASVQLNVAHKIVFQMATGDTLAHKQLMKQINNILSLSSGSIIEIVCHGPGLDMLMTEKSVISEKIAKYTKSGVIFNACEFSMKDRGLEKTQMIPEATYVPSAVIEIAIRQEQGWTYIKSGF